MTCAALHVRWLKIHGKKLSSLPRNPVVHFQILICVITLAQPLKDFYFYSDFISGWGHGMFCSISACILLFAKASNLFPRQLYEVPHFNLTPFQSPDVLTQNLICLYWTSWDSCSCAWDDYVMLCSLFIYLLKLPLFVLPLTPPHLCFAFSSILHFHFFNSNQSECAGFFVSSGWRAVMGGWEWTFVVQCFIMFYCQQPLRMSRYWSYLV